MFRKSLYLIVFCVFTSSALADIDVGAKYANEFLTLGADGRASAMGESGVAFSPAIVAGYRNPALLNDLQGGAVIALHADRFAGLVKYDFIALGQRFSPKEVFSLTILRLAVDNIPYTTLEDPSSPIGVDNIVLVDKWVSDSEMALIGAYAFQWRKNLALGVNGKMLSKKVGDNQALGLGFDLGAKLEVTNTFLIGAKLSDVTTTFLAWDTGHNELILPSLSLGFAKFFPLQRTQADLNLAVDVVVRGENRGSADQFHYSTFSSDLHLGAEYIVLKTLSLRAGLDRQYFTAGAGLRLGAFNTDYAFQSHQGLGESHRVSLCYHWKGNPFRKG
jgi:hypothetical protein